LDILNQTTLVGLSQNDGRTGFPALKNGVTAIQAKIGLIPHGNPTVTFIAPIY